MDSHEEKTYLAIDLKSFYASVECVERKLDPLTTNLVVADESRTEKTICLAVSPSLKAYGIPGRARLFEVVQRVQEVNALRKAKAPTREFTGESYMAPELNADPSLKLAYIAAKPRMSLYMKYSTNIYRIYLKYVAPEDMHIYSVDEVFLDVTDYLNTYKCDAKELSRRILKDILDTYNITATAGIGTNMYLAKVAMDIVAKHMDPDENGARIAMLTEQTYREYLWSHEPITDFWRVGRGIAKKLAAHGMHTMGDVAKCSVGKKGEYFSEDLLYKLFGVNAELLIDHAWGWEPCTISEVHSYKPSTNSLSSGQVLKEPYTAEKARIITREMTDLLSLDLVEKGVMTDQMTLTIGYDVENLLDPERRAAYKGEIITDHYGREVPKYSHGTYNLEFYTSSTRMMTEGMMELYDRIVDPSLLIRRINVCADRVLPEDKIPDARSLEGPEYEQMDLFTDYAAEEKEKAEIKKKLDKERALQEATLELQHRFGKNAVLKGMSLQEGATTIERNGQVGGHKA